jgi:hypothetical protein
MALVEHFGGQLIEEDKFGKDDDFFASHWSKQLVGEIGGLNEAIYGSGWIHLIRKKNGKSLAYLRRPFGHLEKHGGLKGQ